MNCLGVSSSLSLARVEREKHNAENNIAITIARDIDFTSR